MILRIRFYMIDLLFRIEQALQKMFGGGGGGPPTAYA